MKAFLVSIFTLLVFSSLAQNCNGLLYMTDNAQIQMTVYNAKGKESVVQNWTVSNVKKEGDNYSSTINNVMTDEKGKELGKSTGEYKCSGGVLKVDARMSLPAEQMASYKPSEAKVESGYLEYPYDMAVGQSLKDIDMTMDMTMMNGGMTGSAQFRETNRKVAGKESLTTPAGSWDAYKITYDGFFKIKMVIGIPMNMTVTEWFVPGIGIVKSESYKKGKLIGSTVITSIKK